MAPRAICLTILVSSCLSVVGAADEGRVRVARAAATNGLVAFWDFRRMDGSTWTSYRDPKVVSQGYPVFLRRIGDPKACAPGQWPYMDKQSQLAFDTSGPSGHAINLNRGRIFAEVPRSEFDQSPLDIHGRQPFTLIAWQPRASDVANAGKRPRSLNRTIDGIEIESVVKVVPLGLPFRPDVDVVDDQQFLLHVRGLHQRQS